MRVVLDTNVVVSALLWGGATFRLLQLAQVGDIDLLTSPALTAELARVLGYPRLEPRIVARNMTVAQLVSQYQAFAQTVLPLTVPAVIKDDPDDDQVLACAVAGRADLIVSGDKHLHGLGGQYNGISIVRPADAVRIIEAG